MIAANTWNQRTRRLSHSRIDEVTLSTPYIEKRLNSASPVRRIPVWAQEERNVKVRFSITRLERDFHHRMQCVDVLQRIVTPGVKTQPIDSRGEIFSFRQQLSTPAILIGTRRGQQPPICGWVLFLQSYRHVLGRLAKNDVQNVGRNAVHP